MACNVRGHVTRMSQVTRMTLTFTVACAAHRSSSRHGRPAVHSEQCTGQQPTPGKSSAHYTACGVLQTLGRFRRARRSVAIMLSALLLFLTTAGTCSAFPEFACCPDRANHAQPEHAHAGSGQGADHDHAVAPLSHSDSGVSVADSPDCDPGNCECCQSFFLAHLSAIPVAITVPIFPDCSVDHPALCRMALEFASAPPVPPPQPYLV